MVTISMKTNAKVVDDVEEIFKGRKDKNGYYITETLGEILSRKLRAFGKTTKQIETYLRKFISNSNKIYYSALSLNDRMANSKAIKIAKKYNNKSIEFKPWNKIEGISLIFVNKDKILSISINAIRTTENGSTNIIFDVYNVEIMDNKNIDPIKYRYKETTQTFNLSEDTNTSSELRGWDPEDFFEEVKNFSKGFRKITNENIENALYLSKWSAWANVLSTYAANSDTSTIFGLKNEEYSSGENVSGYVVLNSDWEKIEKSTHDFKNTVSILTSDGNSVRTNISADDPESANKIFESKILKPFKERIKSEKINKETISSSIVNVKNEINNIAKKIEEIKGNLVFARTEIDSVPETIEVEVRVKKKTEKPKNKNKDKKDEKNNNFEIKLESRENPIYKKALKNLKTIENSYSSLENMYESKKNDEFEFENKLNKSNNKINFISEKMENTEVKIKNYINEIGNKKLVPVKFIFESKITDLKFNLPSYENIGDVNISASDVGSIKLAGRIRKAKKRLLSASYKNPFLLSSFLNIGLETLTPNKKLKINKNGWEFNEGQLKAIGKMDSNKSTFFLQGPPGTGKTTTISRFAEIQATKAKQILMTSSTKAAITGFIESVEKMSSDNPNVFAVLNIPFSDRKDELKYTVNTLYKRHIDKIFGQKSIKNEATIGPELLNDLKELITEQDIKDIKSKKITTPFLKKSIGKKIKDALRDIDGLSSSRLENIIEKLRDNDDFVSNEQQNEIDNAIKSGFLAYKDGNYTLKDKSSNNSDDLKTKVLNKIKNYNREKAPELIEEQFNGAIVKSGLINVIAQTNTSRLSLETLSGIKDLQVDFDIDTVIIDEVSKSITLEVLRMASNAKRAIFAGDYRQLPPDNNYDKKAIFEIYFSIVKNWEKLKKTDTFIWPNGDKKHDAEETYEFFQNLRDFLNSEGEDCLRDEIEKICEDEAKSISDLYKDSLFKSSMISAIKANKPDSNYEILTESRRFNDSILEVVNTFYDGKEKLIPYANKGDSKNGKNISFKAFGKTHKGLEVYWVDTSLVSNSSQFKEIVKKDTMMNGKYVSYNYKTKGSALKNKFNAIVGLEIVSSLIDGGIKQNEIGIICLNSGQKNLLKDFIGTKYPGVVIETIGWFQGREKEIIITDFVWASHRLNEDNKLKPRGTDRIDFVSYERVNVGVSRAKRLLINIGAYDSFIKKIRGSYVYANGKTEEGYPYMIKMMWAIENEGEVIEDEN